MKKQKRIKPKRKMVYCLILILKMMMKIQIDKQFFKEKIKKIIVITKIR